MGQNSKTAVDIPTRAESLPAAAHGSREGQLVKRVFNKLVLATVLWLLRGLSAEVSSLQTEKERPKRERAASLPLKRDAGH